MSKHDDPLEEDPSSDLPGPEEFTERRTPRMWRRRLARFPRGLLNTENHRLPRDARNLLASIANEQWDRIASTGAGFTLAGPSGSGKTRSAVDIALRIAAAKWGWPAYLSAVAIRSKAFSDWGASDRIIGEGRKADVLVFDDLGKGTPSTVVDDVVFAILDGRVNDLRPTVITTNYTPEELRQRFKDSETGAAIMRRIQETNRSAVLQTTD